ncbi:MAG: DUF1080 domain-containing protein [Acidobacteria bacterium]|nr:DUF1080 domain-containing protein [Acidobacteriota bacterium]
MRTLSILLAACCMLPAQAPPPAAKPLPPMLPGGRWRVHDATRPAPRVVIPGTESSPGKPGRPPSDALVLFDGTDLSHWLAMTKAGVISEPKWKVENGYVEVVRGTGSLISKEKFGSAQFHIEWAAPSEVTTSGQRRGNSGIFLMRRYEIQILDSWQNETYADGSAAAIYGQYPPLVNSSRKPGEWQVYDLLFEAPVFDAEHMLKPPYVTLLHNGIAVHIHAELLGRIERGGATEPFAPEGPLMLQDHPGPVRFRNIWVRPLKGYAAP